MRKRQRKIGEKRFWEYWHDFARSSLGVWAEYAAIWQHRDETDAEYLARLKEREGVIK